MWPFVKKQPVIRSLIGEGTTVHGEVRFSDGLRIDGEVHGDVVALGEGPSLLVVSEKARVHGKVKAGHVIINGNVVGPVEALELLELQPKARIEGDVSYAAVEMHLGSQIDGAVHAMRPEGERPPLKLAASSRL